MYPNLQEPTVMLLSFLSDVVISSVIASQKTKTFFFYSLLWSCSFCFLSIRFNGQLALD